MENIKLKENTIMDIMGNSRDEIMCSNMLAFYFNPNEEHGLDNLVLKCFIEILKTKKIIRNYSYKNIVTIREQRTLKDNWIDIVIKNDDCVIGIENKIDADLDNDLYDYSKTLESINSNAIKIVLSINSFEEKLKTNYNKSGFVNITYNDFFEVLEKEMRIYENKTNKWYYYLEDFIVNLKKNGVEHYLKKQIENNELKLDKTIEDYKNEMENKIIKLFTIIRKDNKKIQYNISPLDNVAYIVCNGGFNIDARLLIDGWNIGICAWRKSKIIELKEFLNIHKIPIESEKISQGNHHFWIKHFDYNEGCRILFRNI